MIHPGIRYVNRTTPTWSVLLAAVACAKSHLPWKGDAIIDLAEILSEIFVGLLELIGFTAEAASERKQGMVIFGVIGLFSVICGCCLTDWAAIALFGVAGFCLLVFVLLLTGIAH